MSSPTYDDISSSSSPLKSALTSLANAFALTDRMSADAELSDVEIVPDPRSEKKKNEKSGKSDYSIDNHFPYPRTNNLDEYLKTLPTRFQTQKRSTSSSPSPLSSVKRSNSGRSGTPSVQVIPPAGSPLTVVYQNRLVPSICTKYVTDIPYAVVAYDGYTSELYDEVKPLETLR